MMAWMNRESVARTVETGQTHFYSRSRGKLWLKGGQMIFTRPDIYGDRCPPANRL